MSARAILLISIIFAAGSAAADPIGMRAKGGHPEYLFLESLMEPCLPCHGKPKGEPDMLGYAKDGLEAGDLIGLMSVTVAVDD
ncbi:MAG: DUF3365 domain-containing protein [Burkholderiaceae bacterium]|nr:DUF3365 domain-containing protein [Burkholderiaceae bacterium]